MADEDQEISLNNQEDENLKPVSGRLQPIAAGLNEENEEEDDDTGKLLGRQSQHHVSASSEELDSEDEDYHSSSRRHDGKPTSLWCTEPAIKRNYCIMILITLFFIGGIVCFIVGIVMEVLYHTVFDNILRGLALMLVAIFVLIPSGYALLHVYLAAKRVGRVRFSSVWFFPY